MKLSLLFLLPAASLAFAPVRTPSIRTFQPPSILINKNEVTDACDKITETTEDVLDKADGVAITRVMRVADHAPILWTLKRLTDKAGIAISKTSINASPGAFTGLGTALSVPTWCFNIWAVIALAQVASVAKSALAEDNNELSQKDITTMAAANFCATRAIGSSNALLDTGLTALVAGYALRKNDQAGEVSVHNAALQMMTSFTTVLAVLGLVSTVTANVPVLNEIPEAASLLGVAAYYIMVNRGGNGTVKKAVNAGIIGGVLYSRIAAGVSLSASTGSVLSGISLLGIGYVAFEAFNGLKKALFD